MDSPDGSLSLTQRSYFKIAKTISDLSDHRCRVGAVVVHKHHIISSGHNSASKTHAFQARLDKRTFIKTRLKSMCLACTVMSRTNNVMFVHNNCTYSTSVIAKI